MLRTNEHVALLGTRLTYLAAPAPHAAQYLRSYEHMGVAQLSCEGGHAAGVLCMMLLSLLCVLLPARSKHAGGWDVGVG
jgi:hypothetical protein